MLSRGRITFSLGNLVLSLSFAKFSLSYGVSVYCLLNLLQKPFVYAGTSLFFMKWVAEPSAFLRRLVFSFSCMLVKALRQLKPEALEISWPLWQRPICLLQEVLSRQESLEGSYIPKVLLQICITFRTG